MDILLTINLWFLVSLCLVSVLIGILLGVRFTADRRADHVRPRW